MVTSAQKKVRDAFKKCVICFRNQPESGGVTPPDIGPRNRSWWYSQAGGEWYYNYFIRESWQTFFDDDIPEWCRSVSNIQGTANNYSKRGTTYYESFGTASSLIGVKNNHYPGGDTAERTLWQASISGYDAGDLSACRAFYFNFTFLREKIVAGYYNMEPITVSFYAYPYDESGLPADWTEIGGGTLIDTITIPANAADTYYQLKIDIKAVVAEAIDLGYSSVCIYTISDHESEGSYREWIYTYGTSSSSNKPYLYIAW